MSDLEDRFIAAGWNKLDANRYQHKDGRKLEREGGYWYLSPLKGRREKHGFTLGDAIRKVMNASKGASA